MDEQIAVLRQELESLSQRKEVIELECQAITSELTSIGPNGQHPAGISDALVDKEGFPRGDIDIYNVKNKRRRLRELNTDYTDVMKKIETLLPRLFELTQNVQIDASKISLDDDTSLSHSSSSTKNSFDTLTQNELQNMNAFAKIDEVLENSPAYQCGLRDNDMLLQFGHLTFAYANTLNTNPFNLIPNIVKEHIGKGLQVIVSRKDEFLILTVYPKTWSGRGVLGCHFTPLS